MITCNYCGKSFEIGNRPDGLPNGVGFQTATGTINVCAECLIEMGKVKEAWKNENNT